MLAIFRLKALEMASVVLSKEGMPTKEGLEKLVKESQQLPGAGPAEALFFHEFVSSSAEFLLSRFTEVTTLVAKFNSVPKSKQAQQRVRLSLMMDKARALTVYDVRKAVVSALLTPLRQKVGSCFATAPAILVQKILPSQLLVDLADLLYKGHLLRSLGGKHYKAPCCNFYKEEPFLEDHPLLRAWEYTMATFSDFKPELYKYNLYNSLGLSHEEEGGIGYFIYTYLQPFFESQKKEIDSFREEIRGLEYNIATLQASLASADNSEKARRLQRQLESQLHQKSSLIHEDQKKVEFEHKISTLYVYLRDSYTHLFGSYFQEVFNPSLVFSEAAPVFEDAPAGFMLLYKGGYLEPSMWDLIDSEEAFIKSLSSFFSATAGQIKEEYEWKNGHNFMDELFAHIDNFVRSKAFIQRAKERAQQEQTLFPGAVRLPWKYCSGGSMEGLLTAYFNRETEPKCTQQVVHSPLMLLTFFIDTIKSLPPIETKPFEQDSSLPMLAAGPSHGFSLLPGRAQFKKAWEDRGLTYTWIRDEIINPARKFYQSIYLTRAQSQFLFAALLRGLKMREKASPSFEDAMSPNSWADRVLDFAKQGQISAISKEVLAVFLRGALPLVESKKVPKEARLLENEKKQPFILANQWFNRVEVSEPERFVKRWQKEGLLPPAGLVVGDTNWPLWFFSFLVNPLTLELSLWRTDLMGLFGYPMSQWDMFMSEEASRPWKLFVDVREYSFPQLGLGHAMKV